MSPCPWGPAAWMCEFYIHVPTQYLCQHKQHGTMTEQLQTDKPNDCEGYHTNKRMEAFAERIQKERKR
ncbi:hypothetical protein CMI37_36940 [Candidatus Pacearchaeota archaeon]|nr:hypothetical protein [Candidatus Pacearchaeota archaeon]